MQFWVQISYFATVLRPKPIFLDCENLEKFWLVSLRISRQSGAKRQCRSRVEILSNFPIFPARQSIFSAKKSETSVRNAEFLGRSSWCLTCLNKNKGNLFFQWNTFCNIEIPIAISGSYDLQMCFTNHRICNQNLYKILLFPLKRYS